MMKLMFIVTGVIVFVGNVYAFEANFQSHIKGETVAVCNGRFWNDLDYKSKSVYILAFDEGAFNYGTLLRSLDDNKVSKEERLRLDEKVSNQLIIKMNIDGIISFLDKFYSEPLNINIPIHFALTILYIQKQGSTPNDMVQLLRVNSEPENNGDGRN